MICRFNQHCCILESEMSFCAPRRVCLNGNKWFVGPRLHPPRSAPCIDDDPLPRMCAGDTTRDGVNPFSATLGRRRNLAQFDGGALRGLRRPAAWQNASEEHWKKKSTGEDVLNSNMSQTSQSGFSARGDVLRWPFCVNHSTPLAVERRPRKTFGDLRAM
jgi:hypothetical protein